MEGFVNGSDILFKIAGKNVGHCTSHDTTYTAETKERAFKPVEEAQTGDGMWTEQSVNKLSIATNFEGLRNFSETEHGFKSLLDAWYKGLPIECEAYERGSETPYMVVDMIITSLQETNPASDDATYSGSLQNSGKPKTFTPSKGLTGETIVPPPAGGRPQAGATPSD